MSTSIYLGVCFSFITFLFSGFATADAIIKPPQDRREYAELTLENDLRVIVVSDPNTAMSAATLLVEVGFFQDPAKFDGMAHYLEHMVLQGSKKYPELNGLSKLVEKHSGSLNAFTFPDKTQYFLSIPNQHFPEALDRFAEQFANPLLDQTYSDKERQAIHNEWSIARDNDAAIVQRINGLLSNPQHPAGRLGVGNKFTLQDQGEIKLHDGLVNFHRTYYSANRMILVLAGKESTSQLAKLAKQYFSKIPNHKIAKPEIATPGLISSQLSQYIQYKPFIAGRGLTLEFSISDSDDLKIYKPLAYINQLITTNQPGTLTNQLQEKLWINGVMVAANPSLYGKDGVYKITFDMTEEGVKHQQEIIAATFSYLNLIAQKGVTNDHFTVLQVQMEKGFKELQSPDLMALNDYLANAARHEPFKNLLYAPYSLSKFNQKLITNTIKQLQPENMRVWLIAPEAEGGTLVKDYEGSYKVTPISEAQIKDWRKKAAEWTFTVPEAIKQQQTASAKITEKLTAPVQIINTDKTQVWLMHSQYYSDQKGLFYLVFNNDLGEQNAQNFILSLLLKELLIEQNQPLLQRYYRMGIDTVLERTPYSTQFIQLSGDVDKQPELLEKLMNSLVTLNYSDKQFNRARANMKDWVTNWDKAQPIPQMVGVFKEHMEIPARNSQTILPYIDKVKPEDLEKYRQQMIKESFLLVFAFGHYPQQTLTKMIDGAESVLGERAPKGIYQKQYVKPKSNLAFTVNREADQGDNALLDVFVSNQPSVKQRASLWLINTMLNNAIFSNLRTKEQLAYAVGSELVVVNKYPGIGIFIQSENTELPALKKRFDEFRQQFYLFLSKLDAATLEQIKQSLIVQVEQKPQNMYAEGDMYFSDFLDGNYQFNTQSEWVNAVKSANVEDLRATYSAILQGDSFNMVIQQRGKKFKNSDFALPDKFIPVSSSHEFQRLMQQ